MFRYWLLATLCACSEAHSSAASAPDARVDRVADAAPMPKPAPPATKPMSEDAGFDFRRVPLDDSYLGTEQLCVVGRIDGTKVRCETERHHAMVELDRVPEGMSARDVLTVKVTAPGKATLIERAGRLPDPEPPSRCACKEPPPETEKPPPPEGYDFSKVYEDNAWGTDRVCEVSGVHDVEKGALPDLAPFTTRVWCGGEQVVVGESSYYGLLALEQGDVVKLRLTWVAHQVYPTALYRSTLRRAAER